MLNSSFSEILSEVADNYSCRQATLLTRAGSIVGISRGAEASVISTHESQVSAIASSLAASSRELYRILGEEEPEYLLIRGIQQSTLVSEMPNRLLLIAVFPSAVTEERAREAAEFVGNRLLQLNPASLPEFPDLDPALRDQTLRFLDEVFATPVQ
jgi:predicted regulator of Ras-like GTPase activity (Roadblock/LC7/MglB family)